jgi:protein kinase C substrate 80K-H
MRLGALLVFSAINAPFICEAGLLDVFGKGQRSDLDTLKGVNPSDTQRYSGEKFVCGSTTLPIDKINDDFCDCVDGSDEPGTSACDNGSFVCKNAGYRLTKIPSSRVGDSVCDCCDGSDEANGVCSNDCDAVAAAARKQLEKQHSAYQTGSAIRNELIRDAEKKINECKTRLESIRPDLDQVSRSLEQARAIVTAEESLEKEEAAAMKSSVSTQLSALLGLDNMQEATLAPLLSTLFSVYDMLEDDVSDVLTQAMAAPSPSAQAVVREEVNVDFGDGVDGEAYYADEQGSDSVDDPYGGEEEEVALDEEPKLAASTDEEETAKSTISAENCGLLKHSADERLYPICSALQQDKADLSVARQFLAHLILARNGGEDMQVLLGFQKVFGTLDGAKEYHRQLTSTPLSENRRRACPVDFEQFPGVCGIGDSISAVSNKLDYRYHRREEAESARSAVKNLEESRRHLQEKMRECEKEVEEGEKFEGFLEFLSLKDQCYEQKDGNFVYSVCMLGQVTQKENGRGNSVVLGKFKSPAESIKPHDIVEGTVSTPGLRMLYDRGTHCHAFGARSAEVIVSCGPENVLSEASEPSTCFYSFKLETPAACTPQFAKSIGL